MSACAKFVMDAVVGGVLRCWGSFSFYTRAHGMWLWLQGMTHAHAHRVFTHNLSHTHLSLAGHHGRDCRTSVSHPSPTDGGNTHSLDGLRWGAWARTRTSPNDLGNTD